MERAKNFGIVAIGGMIAVAAGSGCDGILLVRPSTTTIELVNLGAFQVDVDLFYSDTQEIPEALIQALGEEQNFSLAAGTTERFSRDCDDLQAVIVDDADLRVIGSIGVDTESEILRDGDDFGCGDTITFTFRHSANLTDFDVTTNVR